MIIGITEFTVDSRRDFSDLELEQLIRGTLKFKPLGEIYTKVKILPPIPFHRVIPKEIEKKFPKDTVFGEPSEELGRRILEEIFLVDRRDELRKKYKVHALIVCRKREGYLEDGEAYGKERDYGLGLIFVCNPHSKLIGHELGHLFHLSHTYLPYQEGYTFWMDLMVQGKAVREAEGFSPPNLEKIRKSMVWYRRMKRKICGITIRP